MVEHFTPPQQPNELGYWPWLGEQLYKYVEYQPAELYQPPRPLSAAAAMLALTGATRVDQIGRHGPSKTALTPSEFQDDPAMKIYSSTEGSDVFFTRDGHVVAGFSYEEHPALTQETVMHSLRSTCVSDSLWVQPELAEGEERLYDEHEPGKVAFEVRRPDDPNAVDLAEKRKFGWPYYAGAVDTTGKNVLGIARIALDTRRGPGLEFLKETYTGLDGIEHTVEEALGNHLDWIRGRMRFNREGLVEALHVNPHHHANQGWEDSPDAFFHADGSWAKHHPDKMHDPNKRWGVASLEVQVETYDALLAGAEVYRRLAVTAQPSWRMYYAQQIRDLTDGAAKLRSVIMDKFWVDDPAHAGGFFARGTDRDDNGNLRPLAVRSADMGFMLDSAVLMSDDPETTFKREAVIRNLFSAEMLCQNGIRTLSSDSPRYGKDRWHNGASWPWVTYKIARGLERHGYHGLAYLLKQRILEAYQDTGVLSEYLSGGDDPAERRVMKDVVIVDPSVPSEPERHISRRAQIIQAWTVAVILAIKREAGQRLGVLRPRARSAPGLLPDAAEEESKRALEQELLKGIVVLPVRKRRVDAQVSPWSDGIELNAA